MEEEWISLGHLGFSSYEACRTGYVRRINGKRGILQPKVRDNRLYISLKLKRNDDKFSTIKIDEIIAKTFLGPPPAINSEVIHIDGNALNSHGNNLRWGTKDEKIQMERGPYRSVPQIINPIICNEDWRPLNALGFSAYQAEKSGSIRKISNNKIVLHHIKHNSITVYLRGDDGKQAEVKLNKIIIQTLRDHLQLQFQRLFI